MFRCHYAVAFIVTLYQCTCWNYQLNQTSMTHDGSTYSIHHLDHGGYTTCHPHNIECMNKTQTYPVTSSQISTTGLGLPYMTHSRATKCALKDAPEIFSLYSAMTIMEDFLAFSVSSPIS